MNTFASHPQYFPQPDAVRYETMPFASAERDARQLAKPLTLTVTCSPRHGVDHTVQFGATLRSLGYVVICHIAARMVKGAGHLDELLAEMREAGIRDVFVVGGDYEKAVGPYRCGFDLSAAIKGNRNAPRSIGVPAYPEGHPLIDNAVLVDDLTRKAQLADYMVTQMCFDSNRLVEWLQRTREQGIALPAVLGVPGMVDRKRLLELSLRVGVGPSLSFLRKQHGAAGRLFGRAEGESERLYRALAPMIGGELGVAGLHLFTFNRLRESYEFVQSQAGPSIHEGVTHLADPISRR